uniref:US10 n=2 Tax=anatid alphaherpesvirus 1 TaxID=104388 RepID=E7D243_9ALPH|nr:US10 [Anatid alphaherpesvirus 1]
MKRRCLNLINRIKMSASRTCVSSCASESASDADQYTQTQRRPTRKRFDILSRASKVMEKSRNSSCKDPERIYEKPPRPGPVTRSASKKRGSSPEFTIKLSSVRFGNSDAPSTSSGTSSNVPTFKRFIEENSADLYTTRNVAAEHASTLPKSVSDLALKINKGMQEAYAALEAYRPPPAHIWHEVYASFCSVYCEFRRTKSLFHPVAPVRRLVGDMISSMTDTPTSHKDLSERLLFCSFWCCLGHAATCSMAWAYEKTCLRFFSRPFWLWNNAARYNRYVLATTCKAGRYKSRYLSYRRRSRRKDLQAPGSE